MVIKSSCDVIRKTNDKLIAENENLLKLLDQKTVYCYFSVMLAIIIGAFIGFAAI